MARLGYILFRTGRKVPEYVGAAAFYAIQRLFVFENLLGPAKYTVKARQHKKPVSVTPH